MRKTVAIIFGGEGKERDVSTVSARTLSTFIDKSLYAPLLVFIAPSGEWYILPDTPSAEADVSLASATPTFPVRLGGKSGLHTPSGIAQIDLAVIALHGDFGEDGVIQGLLTAANIPYIGQSVYASAMTADKSYTKLVAERLGIPTAEWILLNGESVETAVLLAEKELAYPVFVKPTRLGSSIGASPAHSKEELILAYNRAKELDCGPILIEKLRSVKYEVECAYLNIEGKPHLRCGVLCSDGSFYDFGAKYKGHASPSVLEAENLPSDLISLVENYSILLIDFLGLKSLSRIDFFVDVNNCVLFNEINTIPGMTPTSLYPKLTEQMGLKKGEFINLLIKEAITNDRHI